MHIYLLATDKQRTKNLLADLVSQDTENITAVANKNDIYLYIYLQELKASGLIKNIERTEDVSVNYAMLLSVSNSDVNYVAVKDTIDRFEIQEHLDTVAIPNIVNCSFIAPHHQVWGNIPLGFANTWSNNLLNVEVQPSEYKPIYRNYIRHREDFIIPSFYVRPEDYQTPSFMYWNVRCRDRLAARLKGYSYEREIQMLMTEQCRNQEVVVIGDHVCFDLEGMDR